MRLQGMAGLVGRHAQRPDARAVEDPGAEQNPILLDEIAVAEPPLPAIHRHRQPIGIEDRRRRLTALRVHLANKMPNAPAFAVPPKDHSAKMVKADLDGAREAWLKEAATPELRADRERTGFLLYRDFSGRYLDFQALRHTRGVWLFEHHKAHPREVQELMGVSSLSLVDRYTQSFRLMDLSVIERGPDLTIPEPAGEAKTPAPTAAWTQKPCHLACHLWPDSPILPWTPMERSDAAARTAARDWGAPKHWETKGFDRS